MPIRIAIVGGGLSGLTAAYELSRTPELRDRYEVTVYQIGWRLGGKLASGRNPERSFRNEEHGLHVWFGFYQNAFRLLGELDTRWQHPKDFPFPRLCDGFLPESYTPVGDRDGDVYRPWHLHFPRNAGWPGTGDAVLSGWEALTHMVGWLVALLRMAADSARLSSSTLRARTPWRVGPTGALTLAARMVDAAARPVAAMLAAGARTTPATRVAAGDKLARMLALASRAIIPVVDMLARRDARFGHPRAIIETTLAFLRGILSERYGVLHDLDLDRLNHLDFRDFLVENGARRETVDDWSGIRGVYEAMFQYIDGDSARPSFEAGTASRILLRAGLLYRGAALWVPRAGMGELLIAPLYDVLVQQGVRVELFHEMVKFEAAKDDDHVRRLHFRIQARTRDGSPYRPTFQHKGMTCWGATPDWSQLESGDEMSALGVDFDAPGSGFANEAKVLEAGTHFDRVVLALPLGVLAARRGEPNPCDDILARSPRLTELCRRASLTPSVSVQLWTNRCLGAPGGGSASLSAPAAEEGGASCEIPRHFPAAAFGWSHPLSVWADMRPLLRHESWPSGRAPAASYYLCGMWPARSNDPAIEEAVALDAIAAQLSGPGCHWPGFTWDALHHDVASDAAAGAGPHATDASHSERLRAQLVRVNVRASDLCDGAAVGTSRFRPDVADTGLANLTYCGTWTRTGINSSCVEAAVMSGLAAARAISGEERVIVGETFLARPRRDVVGSAAAEATAGATA
jgi:uncharacterized protein with NAD-binding domain and iron-sulfur cluster